MDSVATPPLVVITMSLREIHHIFIGGLAGCVCRKSTGFVQNCRSSFCPIWIVIFGFGSVCVCWRKATTVKWLPATEWVQWFLLKRCMPRQIELSWNIFPLFVWGLVGRHQSCCRLHLKWWFCAWEKIWVHMMTENKICRVHKYFICLTAQEEDWSCSWRSLWSYFGQPWQADIITELSDVIFDHTVHWQDKLTSIPLASDAFNSRPPRAVFLSNP